MNRRVKYVVDDEKRFYALNFMCPGCNERHMVTVNWCPPGYEPSPGSAAFGKWTFNGNEQLPTFGPSVLVRSGHHMRTPATPGNCACDYQQRYPDQEPWPWPCQRCHSFVRDGMIQFLADCSHALAGQTVALPYFTDDQEPFEGER